MEAKLPDEINRLMDLQAIDRQLQELEQSLSSISSRVERLREELQNNQAALERLSGEDKQLAAARKQAERELAEGEARIRNKRMRLNLIRNEKEMQALAHEVESLKESNARLEAELLEGMESVDARGAQIKELAAAVAKGKTEVAASEKEIAQEVEQLKGGIGKRRKERDKAAAGVEAGLLSRYEMIFSRRGGVAVAPAKDGACQGCRMRLRPQLYNEIQRRAQVHYCPNCQRILYYESEPRA
ncbi:MAG: zinc ribbon domain-containing protein [Candidatus Binataceae bacterium]